MSRRVLIAGNWKMNKTPQETETFIKTLVPSLPADLEAEILVIPPYTNLDRAGQLLSGTDVSLGAQDLYFERAGAFTGAVSGDMLVACRCGYVLIGHSERRHVFGDGDDTLSRKLNAALDAGLHPILCIGETLEQRNAGQMEAVVAAQLAAVVDGLKRAEDTGISYAYEPVWAIGTGETATPAQAQDASRFVRSWIREQLSASAAEAARILYGGSVKPDNAAELLSQPDIDGALIGGASLDPEAFLQILLASQPGG